MEENERVIRAFFPRLVKEIVPSEVAGHLRDTAVLSQRRYEDYLNKDVEYETRNRLMLLYIQKIPDGVKQLILALTKTPKSIQVASDMWKYLKHQQAISAIPEASWVPPPPYPNASNMNIAQTTSDVSMRYLESSEFDPSFISSVEYHLESSGLNLDLLIQQSLNSNVSYDMHGPQESYSNAFPSGIPVSAGNTMAPNMVQSHDLRMEGPTASVTYHGPSLQQRNVFPNRDEGSPPQFNSMSILDIMAHIEEMQMSGDSGEDADYDSSDGRDVANEDEDEVKDALKKAVHKQHEMTALSTLSQANKYFKRSSRRKLLVWFDELSTLVNGGYYPEFGLRSRQLERTHPNNHDLMFTLLYLEASAYLWQNEFEKCERVVKKAIVKSQSTSRPCRSLVEILSSRCWMYFQESRYHLLQRTVDEAIQMIELHPIECTGMAAGWIYVDKARLLTALLSVKKMRRLKRMRAEAITCIEEALGHFKNDESKDKEFGIAFSTIMLAMILLGCGDRLQTIEFRPSEEDVKRARGHIRDVQDSAFGVPGVLMVHVYLSLCDFHIRKGLSHRQKATVYAKDAFKMAGDLNMMELRYYAEVRLRFLRHHFVPHKKPEQFSLIPDTSGLSSSETNEPVPDRTPPPQPSASEEAPKESTTVVDSGQGETGRLPVQRSLIATVYNVLPLREAIKTFLIILLSYVVMKLLNL